MLVSLAIGGCRTIADKEWPVDPGERPSNTGSPGGIRIIQINEGSAGYPQVAGQLFTPEHKDQLAQWLRQSPDSPIVLYVHGWHHNASGKKDNLPKFREFIAQLDRDICAVGRQVRRACAAVQGIYVGWRGDAQDAIFLPRILEFTDAPTFHERKEASSRVGMGDLRQVLDLVRDFKDRDVFVAGHSLGANALYNALREEPHAEVADRHEYFLLNPAITSKEFALFDALTGEQDGALNGEGTVIAARERIARRQHRKVLLLQATKDTTVGKIFQSAYGLPIGFDLNRRTHTATARPLGHSCAPLTARGVPDKCKTALDSGLTIQVDPKFAEQCEVAYAKGVWIAWADASLSGSHGDIWDPEQRCALSELIAKRVNRIEDF
ncbi:hypothetical protein [Lysobacter sp. M2-1]|uniref:hypothetical protein n=1 Tax=Lysobacter sp. M2-1 TaxID=2916839 RepID=UPI001F582D39|nr:hypothetical protein [Lysobacter sp. M2-1]